MRKPVPQVFENDIQASNEGHRWLDLVRSYIVEIKEISINHNPALLPENTHREDILTANGLKVGDIILSIIKPTFTQGFHIGQALVIEENKINMQVFNPTLTTSTPDEEIYKVIYIKNTKA